MTDRLHEVFRDTCDILFFLIVVKTFIECWEYNLISSTTFLEGNIFYFMVMERHLRLRANCSMTFVIFVQKVETF